ncbi:MAG: Protein CbbY [Chlamydiales bacterium]|nr:Protein CbbY [Chlamydiales bacterium]MCH9619356.1 Protein CbbY [Chlamydiales bacterium]MCH9622160.1 Protein CbbY [Chlamydiales bacterium]
MDWIHNYQLFLFDFDGLLADTEKLHFLAYKTALANRGWQLNWDEHQYAQVATFSANGLRKKLTKEYPDLVEGWETFYLEKKKMYLKILAEMGTTLMPGVESLIKAVSEAEIQSCVVTHSPIEQMRVLQKHHPILNSISHWITREDYENPKPHPECYQLAISKFAKPGDQIIGFEDAPRGLQALTKTEAKAILVTKLLGKEELKELSSEMTFAHVPTLVELDRVLA